MLHIHYDEIISVCGSCLWYFLWLYKYFCLCVWCKLLVEWFNREKVISSCTNVVFYQTFLPAFGRKYCCDKEFVCRLRSFPRKTSISGTSLSYFGKNCFQSKTTCVWGCKYSRVKYPPVVFFTGANLACKLTLFTLKVCISAKLSALGLPSLQKETEVPRERL